MICDRSRPCSVFNSLSIIISPVWFSVILLRVLVQPGRINLVIDPNKNLTGAIFEGLDYEAIYILESSIFGHGDFGRLTATLNGTWLSRAELQIAPDTKRFGIAGEVIPGGFSLTGSLPWNRANFSLFYDGPANTWMQGLDIGAVVHYTGQYEDDNVSLTGSPKPQMPRTGGPGSALCPFGARGKCGSGLRSISLRRTRSTCHRQLRLQCLALPRTEVKMSR